jgi:hypothetical protein
MTTMREEVLYFTKEMFNEIISNEVLGRLPVPELWQQPHLKLVG